MLILEDRNTIKEALLHYQIYYSLLKFVNYKQYQRDLDILDEYTNVWNKTIHDAILRSLREKDINPNNYWFESHINLIDKKIDFIFNFNYIGDEIFSDDLFDYEYLVDEEQMIITWSIKIPENVNEVV
jgi:hypothetical protein